MLRTDLPALRRDSVNGAWRPEESQPLNRQADYRYVPEMRNSVLTSRLHEVHPEERERNVLFSSSLGDTRAPPSSWLQRFPLVKVWPYLWSYSSWFRVTILTVYVFLLDSAFPGCVLCGSDVCYLCQPSLYSSSRCLQSKPVSTGSIRLPNFIWQEETWPS